MWYGWWTAYFTIRVRFLLTLLGNCFSLKNEETLTLSWTFAEQKFWQTYYKFHGPVGSNKEYYTECVSFIRCPRGLGRWNLWLEKRAFRGPCVRKLFTGLIMYLPSQNKEHCIVLYCILLLTCPTCILRNSVHSVGSQWRKETTKVFKHGFRTATRFLRMTFFTD